MAVKRFNLAKPPKAPLVGIYGPSGASKTTLVSTMPGVGTYIDVPYMEEGGFVIGSEAYRIHGVRIEEWEDLEDVYWALKKRDLDQMPWLGERNDPKRCRWFALDSATGTHTLATRKVIGERDRSLGEQPHHISLQERGWISQLEAEMIFRLRSLDEYWQIFVAQERQHGGFEGDPGPVQMGPDLPAGSLRAFKQSATILGRLGVVTTGRGKEERQLRIGPPDGDFIVKARTPKGRPKLPKLIKDPNLDEILRFVFADGPTPKAARDDAGLNF